MHYINFLDELHRRLEPEVYLEIGVRSGTSLALARCRAIGIDPAFSITTPIDNDVALFRTTSDEYFARPEPLAPTGGRPIDLSFIDGLHLFEFALRDFINVERHATSGSLIVFDDILPATPQAASRTLQRGSWTGDVYPILPVLERYRPDLIVVPISVQPTGLLLVLGLDPSSTVLRDNYDAIVAEYRKPDPQPVPQELMDRFAIFPAQRVLESRVLDVLAGIGRDRPADEARSALAEAVRDSWGAAFASELSYSAR
jgi:hypothetical protein